MGKWLVYIWREDRKDVITLPIEAAEIHIEEGGVLAFYGTPVPGERKQLIQAFIPGRWLEAVDHLTKEKFNSRAEPGRVLASPRGAAISRKYAPRRQEWES